MVTLLMDGRARTVTELGSATGLAKASASDQVAELAAADALGVRMYLSLLANGALAPQQGGLDLTPTGRAFCHDFGLTEADLAPARASLCRECLGWSERQSHLGGHLGRLLLSRREATGWFARRDGTRARAVTAPGRQAFDRTFPVP